MSTYFDRQTLKKSREMKDQKNEAITLSRLGSTYRKFSRYAQAIEFYEQALAIWQQKKERVKEAAMIFELGRIHRLTGATEKSIRYLEQALTLFRNLKERENEALALSSLALAYNELFLYEKALEFYNQARNSWQALKKPQGELDVLINMGTVYFDLNRSDKAQEYLEQAIAILRTIKDVASEGLTLINLGAIYQDLGLTDKALQAYEQALTNSNKMENPRLKGMALNNLGTLYRAQKTYDQSQKYYEAALARFRSINDRTGSAFSLLGLGTLHNDLGRYQHAQEHFERALPLVREARNLMLEGTTLSSLMGTRSQPEQPRVAIFYGKQAVNVFQQLRGNIRSFDRETQQRFLKSKEVTYRYLASLLIAEGRLPEAQQVLDLLKEEEYFSYVRRDNDEADKLKRRASLTPAEARLEKEYSEIAELVTTLGRELEGLNQLKGLSTNQLARRADLDQKLQLATQRFQAFFGRLEKELGNNSGERLTQIQTSEGFQDTLKALGAGTVALYTVVGEQKYSVILTPGTGPQVAAESRISRADLHKKIFALKDALRNPRVDPRPLAAELYDILIKPIAKNLEGAQADTLMFSLDGALRYLPMGALYDKERGEYLLERYKVVVYTPAGATDLKNAARANWKGLGFGVSKAVSNAEVGNFAALTGVPQELRSVIRTAPQQNGVIEGQVYLDEQFTEQRFLDALRPREYPLIHIASHFAFKPGDSLKSFLLLGDGKALTLEKVQKTPQLFSGVDLLALSACETGVGQKDEEGKEVEGFGVLAQRKGAKAVLATLWPVADESTARLMTEFYRLRETQSGMNKAEALRQAQLQMLRGQARTDSQTDENNRTSRPKVEPGKALPEFKADAKAPYAHPYYWAPFILIGNWK